MHFLEDCNDGLDWDPAKDDLTRHIIVRYSVAPVIDTREVAYFMARIQSTSCFNRLYGETEELRRHRAAKVVRVEGSEFELAFPEQNLSAQLSDILLSTLIDLNSRIYRRLIVEDIVIPTGRLNSFEGPRFGTSLLSMTCGRSRPMLISVVKPSIGISTKEHIARTVDAFRGGSDVVKDDENLYPGDSQNPFVERLHHLATELPKLRAELGRNLIYIFNVQSDLDILAYCEQIKKIYVIDGPPLFGILVSPILGLPYIHLVRNLVTLPIFCHSAGIGLFVGGAIGYSRRAYVKLLRLCGVDALIHSAPGSKGWECGADTAHELSEACGEPMENIAPILLCFGGGLSESNISEVQKLMTSNVYGLLIGGGIMGHPDGPYAGARALARRICCPEE